jgi:ABC-type branched-subunit amino acid transport system ATPase component
VIEVNDLTVRYGGVTSLDGMSLTFDQGVCGLIGPNGAGKTTFFNVLSGFVRPSAGTVTAFDENLLRMTHFRRARWGVRRTFQTEQAISDLTVYDNVAMIHSRLRGAAHRDDVLASIEFVGGGISPWAKVGSLTAGQRRLVEVARAVTGKPRLILLDEPGRGDRAPHRGDPRDAGADRCADHPRRSRHGAGLRGLHDGGGARLRKADRVRTDRGGAAGRARDARLPWHGGGLIPYVIA